MTKMASETDTHDASWVFTIPLKTAGWFSLGNTLL